MEKKIVLLSNGSRDEVAAMAAWLKAGGFSFETIQLTKGEPLPKEVDGVSGLLIMGGPITVYDQDTAPFLKVYFNA